MADLRRMTAMRQRTPLAANHPTAAGSSFGFVDRAVNIPGESHCLEPRGGMDLCRRRLLSGLPWPIGGHPTGRGRRPLKPLRQTIAAHDRARLVTPGDLPDRAMIEHLTYAELAERLGVTAEAARALAKRMRLQRQRGNDGKARVVVDLAEVQHKAMPARSPAGDHPVAALKARIEALQAELAEMEEENATLRAVAFERREDFVRERDPEF
jgi:transposase-like protein